MLVVELQISIYSFNKWFRFFVFSFYFSLIKVSICSALSRLLVSKRLEFLVGEFENGTSNFQWIWPIYKSSLLGFQIISNRIYSACFTFSNLIHRFPHLRFINPCFLHQCLKSVFADCRKSNRLQKMAMNVIQDQNFSVQFNGKFPDKISTIFLLFPVFACNLISIFDTIVPFRC